MSLATVHHYFRSKDQLYAACVASMDDEFALLRDELLALVGQGGSFEFLMAEVVRRSYRFACAHSVAVRLTTRDAIERGEIDPQRQSALLGQALEQGVALLGQLTGASPQALRLVIRSVSFLVVRYSLSSSRELAVVLGWDPESYDEAACQQAVEDHLVFLTQAQFQALSGGAA